MNVAEKLLGNYNTDNLEQRGKNPVLIYLIKYSVLPHYLKSFESRGLIYLGQFICVQFWRERGLSLHARIHHHCCLPWN